MMVGLFTVIFTILPWVILAACFQPVSYADPIHVPILRHDNIPDRKDNLPKVIDAIQRKYGFSATNSKRSGSSHSGQIPLSNLNSQSIYSGVVGIGTPPQNLNVILSMGFSDLLVAAAACTTCTSNAPPYDPSKSSTFANVTSELNATNYGSLTGWTSEDTVTFGGFTVQNQQFFVVDAISPGFGYNVSGFMGLGFSTISLLQAPPFLQTLYNQNLLSEPVFGLFLERSTDRDNSTVPGGTFTLGGTNSGLYTGDIEFINMPNGTVPSYWLQQVQTVTIQGNSISIPGNETLAMIDTDLDLIGAPASVVQQIWSNVPGSVSLSNVQNLSELYQGMYAYPCTTNISISMSFGGATWFINPADMNVTTVEVGSDVMCVGAIITIPDPDPEIFMDPSWVVGTTFLKNVYSVFRVDPPAVGFAQLASKLPNSGGSSISGGVGRSCLLGSFSRVVVGPLLVLLSILA